jgi:hypothetical protein
MPRLKITAFSGVGLRLCAASADAANISGTISGTLKILENSKLIGDVTSGPLDHHWRA